MKISRTQIFWLMISFNTGNMLLLSISPTISDAKQDAWISYLIATIIGALIVIIASNVSLLYPKLTLVEYSKRILGKWLGIIVIIPYLIQWYSVIAVILSEFYEFSSMVLLPTTPPWILFLTLLLLSIYVIYVGKIEGIGRCSEVFGPIIFLMVLLLVLMSIPNMRFEHILPVYTDSGVVPILQGALYPVSLLGESVILLMLLAFIDQPKNATASAAWGIIASSCLVGALAIGVILTFGPEIPGMLRFPAFDMVGYINIMEFIQNFEIVAVLVWILSVFMKVTVYFFLATYGTAQFFNIKDWRKISWVVGISTFVLALIFVKFNLHLFYYMDTFWMNYVLPINMVGIPLLLLIVGKLRLKKS